MLLTIDVGNTNMVFAIYQNNKLIDTFRLSSDKAKTHDEIGLLIIQYLNFFNIDIKSIKDIIICSVVYDITALLKKSIKKFFKFEPLVIGENIKTDIKNLYENETQAGADRIVNAIGAIRKYGTPAIVLDMGTATTIDAVDKSGTFLGGIIYIGTNTLLNAFFIKDFKLNNNDLKSQISVIGKNTKDCMLAGVYYGYIGAMKEIITNIKLNMPKDTKVIATGGLCEFFLKGQEFIDVIDNTLTTDALNFIYHDFLKSRL